MKKNTILIYGINTLYEAIKSKIKIYKIYLNKKNNKNNKIKKIIKYSKKNNISLNEIFNFKKIENIGIQEFKIRKSSPYSMNTILHLI